MSTTIRTATESDIPRMAELYASMHTREPQRAADLGSYFTATFHSKYASNPDRAAGTLPIRLAEIDGRVLGQRPTMPFLLHAHGQALHASWGIDFAVDPASRGQGLGSRMVEDWINRHEVVAALASMAPALRLYARAGFWPVDGVRTFVKVLRPASALRNANGIRRKLASLLGVACSLRAFTPAPPEVPVHSIAGFSPYVAGIQGMLSTYAFVADRRPEVLDWRFGSSARHAYSTAGVVEGGQLLGYVAHRSGGHVGGLPAAVVADLLVARDAVPTARALLRHVAHRTRLDAPDTDALVCRASSRTMERALRAEGFVALSGQTSLVVCSAHGSLSAQQVSHARDWHITSIDSDAEFMPDEQPR